MTYDLNELQALLAKMLTGTWEWRKQPFARPQMKCGKLFIGEVLDKDHAAGIVALVNAARGGLIADHLALQARVAELEAEVARLRNALNPFARAARIQGPLSAGWPDDKPNLEFLPSAWPDWGDFKRANAAYGDQP